jgi:hypothetical protein
VVQLPGNMFTNSKSLTLEIWFDNNKTVGPQLLWNFNGSPPINYVNHVGGGFGGPTIPGSYYGPNMVPSVQWRMVGKPYHGGVKVFL